MNQIMLLVAGRSSKQGTTLNQGKLKPEYIQETSTVEINELEMQRLGLQEGDRVRISNHVGETIATCRQRKATDLPDGMVFMPYGPGTSQLMESDTAGSGMPMSKNMEVHVEKAAP